MSEAKRLAVLAREQIDEVLVCNHGTALHLCGVVVRLRAKTREVQNCFAVKDLDGVKQSLVSLSFMLSEIEDHLAPELVARDRAQALCDASIDGLERHGSDLEAAVSVKGLHAINDPAVRSAVYALTGGRCAYCDVKLEEGTGSTEAFTIEHIVPRDCGGPDNIANYVPACRCCNCSKSTGHVVSFIQRRVNIAAGAKPDLRVVCEDRYQ